mmetsp:Transcript_29780/g.43906  ORF Transcript_29780/g.43906 Transcript_29780/m.43906 type:complete len:526 (-) Transcript_29780:51-1628(-)|eukprot:CAMPEP_0194047216 /NCGR_PEP_ID=MMETSP0009_2-20130614/23628_1 /TAXON_ID=210454 /ORGANISM="Grammatophora oceanica, Strain CCMP 410" /LENGTH=525 /DNA_ID=CAMNT_0038692757 /DNA_START=61 /DNA_END=1638 /DNA_ORIENTATION=-
MRQLRHSVSFLVTYLLSVAAAFVSQSHPRGTLPSSLAPWTVTASRHQTSSSSTQLHMVFDFFKERSKEGVEQLSNLADAAKRGKLGKGLSDAAEYTSETNSAFATGLAKSRSRFLQNMELLFTGSSEDLLEELEDVLLQADLGIKTSEDVVNEVKSLQAAGQAFRNRQDLMSVLRGKLIESLETGKSPAIKFSDDPKIPTVLFVMGANGMGKTTTIGKLAHRLRTEGNQTVLMAACDTFRAGAVEQLVQWAERAEVDCYTPAENVKSPSTVVYGALEKAIAENYDTVLVDTSGRLSNNYALTEELLKMKRTIQKRLFVERDDEGKPILNTNVPHETLIVIDAAQGRMALDSTKTWDEDIGLTGLILTKLDGSARGGSVVAVSRELGLPVKLIGVGEGINDLRDFEPSFYVDGLLGIGAAGGKGGNKNEGKSMEARLADMRKERDAQSKAAKKKTATKKPKEPSLELPSFPSVGDSSGEMELTFQGMDDSEPEIITATGTTPSGGRRQGANKSNNKKKKKKKRKRR